MPKEGGLQLATGLEQKVSCSCLTITIAAIIYWQAKEIHRVLMECPPDLGLDLSLLGEHKKPWGKPNVWKNR